MSETPQEAAARISRLPFLEQFRSHHIVSIETDSLITGTGALAHICGPNNLLRWYRVALEVTTPRTQWPEIVGHELGHASSWTLQPYGNGGYLKRTAWPLKEEEFCDAFAQAWLQLGTNRQELNAVLADITPGKPFVLIPEGYARIYPPRATS